MIFSSRSQSANDWLIERRSDGAVLVRVPSSAGRSLPDAVFAFRSGDPQYGYWERRLREQELAVR